MSELIPISAQIGDRSYRIKVEPRHEELVRRTLSQINNKILELKNQFGGKDMQDYIAMSMLWFATQSPQETTVQQVAEKESIQMATTHPQQLAEHDQELREGLQLLEQLLNEALKS